MMEPLCFGKYAVLALAPCFDSDPMLGQTAEHVGALAYVDGLIVDCNAIDAWILKLLVPAQPFQIGIDIFFIRWSFN